ncbi:hypothetical protein C5167_024831 [Papaver somniferum]|uniref:Uncharacterized protein n=1 Tax=Papaver somniferum TaxID=3469 RepID=A0A4Y7JSR0_PAPSO|nr:hypothetical protein C5167_024831 [Papaver somniferum]
MVNNNEQPALATSSSEGTTPTSRKVRGPRKRAEARCIDCSQ